MQTLGPIVHSASALHGLQVLVAVSQIGVVPLQSAFDTHSTQAPVAEQAGFAPLLIVVHSVLPKVHLRQVFMVVSQKGFVVVGPQCEVIVHSTHLPEVVAHPGVSGSRVMHSSFIVQALQVCVSVRQMGAVATVHSSLVPHSTHIPDELQTGVV
jgi:hypothetical protein